MDEIREVGQSRTPPPTADDNLMLTLENKA